MNRMTLLIPLLAIILLVPGMAFADELDDKYHELTKDEKISLNGERGKEILQVLGGYDNYKELIKSDVESDLKEEIKELDEKMSELGIMTIEELRDPIKRMEFYLDHPEFIEDGNEGIAHVVWTDVSHGCDCSYSVNTQMGYHYPYAWWSAEAYLNPTSWQTMLYPHLEYPFDNDDSSNVRDWIRPFMKVYISQNGVATINGFAGIDTTPHYDENISKTKFFFKNLVKTFDFVEYSNGIGENTYIWGTTTWIP